jgi:hypothetical protein
LVVARCVFCKGSLGPHRFGFRIAFINCIDKIELNIASSYGSAGLSLQGLFF